MQRRRIRPSIVDRDDHEDIVRSGLGVFDEDIEIAVLVEQTGVDQFEFRRELVPRRVPIAELGIWVFALRILVEHFEVRVRRRGVEVIVIFLHVLAVISLRARQAEKPLLQERIAFIPQHERQAETLLVVADAGNAVFAPAIGAA
jgi:hypothetical protein